MSRVVAIGGVPGTGKTLLVKRIIEREGGWKSCEPTSLLTAMYNEKLNLFILGRYEEGEVFSGTDRLSMAVQPRAEEWIRSCRANVLLEGDRLFNQSFLEHLLTVTDLELFIVYLKVSQATLNRRYIQRGSNQSQQFIKGRETKYVNLYRNMKLRPFSREFPHETFEDTQKIMTEIHCFLATGRIVAQSATDSAGIRGFFGKKP